MCLSMNSLTQCDIHSEFYAEEVNMQSFMLMYHHNSNSNVSLPGTKFMVKYTLSELTYPHILLPTVRWGLGLPYDLDAQQSDQPADSFPGQAQSNIAMRTQEVFFPLAFVGWGRTSLRASAPSFACCIAGTTAATL